MTDDSGAIVDLAKVVRNGHFLIESARGKARAAKCPLKCTPFVSPLKFTHGKIMSEFYTELNALSAHTNFIFADGLVATAERHNGASCHFPTIFHFECQF